jgi:hypothetical protein
VLLPLCCWYQLESVFLLHSSSQIIKRYSISTRAELLFLVHSIPKDSDANLSCSVYSLVLDRIVVLEWRLVEAWRPADACLALTIIRLFNNVKFLIQRNNVTFLLIGFHWHTTFPFGHGELLRNVLTNRGCACDLETGFGLYDSIYWHLVHTTRDYRQLQRYRWSTHFTVHRYTRTLWFSAFSDRILATDL